MQEGGYRPRFRPHRILAKAKEGDLFFECAGCDMVHGISTGAGPGPRRGYNGNAESPTFTPSVLVRYSWSDSPRFCHSFVTDGRIQFLCDCTYKLAGQTVDRTPEEGKNSSKTKTAPLVEYGLRPGQYC